MAHKSRSNAHPKRSTPIPMVTMCCSHIRMSSDSLGTHEVQVMVAGCGKLVNDGKRTVFFNHILWLWPKINNNHLL